MTWNAKFDASVRTAQLVVIVRIKAFQNKYENVGFPVPVDAENVCEYISGVYVTTDARSEHVQRLTIPYHVLRMVVDILGFRTEYYLYAKSMRFVVGLSCV